MNPFLFYCILSLFCILPLSFFLIKLLFSLVLYPLFNDIFSINLLWYNNFIPHPYIIRIYFFHLVYLFLLINIHLIMICCIYTSIILSSNLSKSSVFISILYCIICTNLQFLPIIYIMI